MTEKLNNAIDIAERVIEESRDLIDEVETSKRFLRTFKDNDEIIDIMHKLLQTISRDISVFATLISSTRVELNPNIEVTRKNPNIDGLLK